ncbi:hypothetical protein [Bacillus paralicheniformis]|uniref:hypothetical protein n=1 Tax=Bacillus paralicheniformis TaxID=1648923 RepID=UPI00189CAA27|nr:hypothetical protein [Bacillus paralicheniformis]
MSKTMETVMKERFEMYQKEKYKPEQFKDETFSELVEMIDVTLLEILTLEKIEEQNEPQDKEFLDYSKRLLIEDVLFFADEIKQKETDKK